jgi:hypothetical protein
MSTTRTKFVCNSVTESVGSAQNPETKQWEPALQKTISLSPVYGNGDPKHENSKFWAATPSGRLELGVINLAAAAIFVPGKEYYVDITPSEK